MSDLTPELHANVRPDSGVTPRCTNARLEKNAVGVGFRFQVACQGLGSAVQALGFDKVRLRPCPNVRPVTRLRSPDFALPSSR